MTKSFIKSRLRNLKVFAGRQLETGFSMLEAVVVVGVLLALAVSGFIAYGSVTENAKVAAVKSAASQVHTAVLVADLDGDPATTSTTVMNDWNNSNDRIKVRIVGDTVEIGAMTTGEVIPTEPDVCVEAKYVESTDISALSGSCDPVVEPPVVEPTPTPTPTPVVETAGYVGSWGSNMNGQLGNNSNTAAGVPQEANTKGILAGKKISSVSAGQDHSCAVADYKAYCWGNGNYGKLGYNEVNTNHALPVAVITSGALAGKKITAISAGAMHTCVIADGAAYCWGYNQKGQVGNNTLVDSLVPVAVNTSGVLAGKTVTSIFSASNHTCVIADDAAYCWGLNDRGQLGNNTTINSPVPVAVNTSGVLAGKKITAISGGQSQTCALAEGAVYCWGLNGNGQLGNNSKVQSNVPVAVDTSGALAGKTITAMSTGAGYTCVIADGSAYCWGFNFNGALGNNTSQSIVPAAVDTSGVLAGKTVTAISAGGSHTCAVANDAVYCWGLNNYGQVGNNSITTAQVPVAVNTAGILGGKKVIALSTGGSHTLSLFA